MGLSPTGRTEPIALPRTQAETDCTGGAVDRIVVDRPHGQRAHRPRT